MIEITSLQNEQVKRAVHLRDSKKARKTASQFIFEGRREVERAIAGKVKIEEVFLCPEILGKYLGGLNNICEQIGAQIYEVSKSVYEKIALRGGTEGIVAIAAARTYKLTDLKLSEKPLVLVADSIEKPGNLGALLRSADSAGAEAVIVTGERALDLENPNAIRVSLGTIFGVQCAQASEREALDFLKKKKIKVITTTPKASRFYFEEEMQTGCAIVIGSEAWGADPLWMQEADARVKLPQKGLADSLNAAVAGSIVLFEAVRQRETKTK